ncbi:MAG TPA: M20/M25/M40 family metallo-hydrolase [Gaiellaceae bacterium]|jgi:endoglucanase
MAAPNLLRELLSAVGPSGHEGPAAAVWRQAASAFADVSSDSLGTSYARVRAEDGAPTLAIVGHIDEIGIAITHISEDGLLWFTVLGGYEPEQMAGQRVLIAGRNGIVPGVVGRRRPGRDEGRDRPRLKHTDLHVDVGATSRENAEKLVRPGDVAVWEGEPLELPNNRLASRALDNRLGAYAALEAARRVGEAADAAVDVVAVAAVQEEVDPGYSGSRTAAFSLEPDVAIAIDVTWATEIPGGDPKLHGKVELGLGAAITRGPVVNTRVSDLLAETAEEEKIPHCFEIYTGRTMTDADAVFVSRGGVPTGLVSIPLRYMHSPVELCSLDDLEAVVSLVAAFARRLTRETSFVR